MHNIKISNTYVEKQINITMLKENNKDENSMFFGKESNSKA